MRTGRRRLTGGRSSSSGTPQGGVISPLLANLYMNRLLKYWRLTGRTRAYAAHIVSYADDFVILSRGHAAEALGWTRHVTGRMGLALNDAKTSLRNARNERFDFLGYAFGPHWRRQDGKRYLGASPSKKSVQRIKDKIGAILVPRNTGSWPMVRDRLNSLLQGWHAYFGYGTRRGAYRAIDDYVYDHVRHFLARRRKLETRGTHQLPAQAVFGTLGVLRLRSRLVSPPWALP